MRSRRRRRRPRRPYEGRGGAPPTAAPRPCGTRRPCWPACPTTPGRRSPGARGRRGPSAKAFGAVRVHRATGNPDVGPNGRSVAHERVTTGPVGWLLGERPLPGHHGESKQYFLWLPGWLRDAPGASGHPGPRPVGRRPAYEDAKGECGLADYQGRRWDGLHRHLALTWLAYTFLVLQRLAPPRPPTRPRPPRPRAPPSVGAGRPSSVRSHRSASPVTCHTEEVGEGCDRPQAQLRVGGGRLPRQPAHGRPQVRALGLEPGDPLASAWSQQIRFGLLGQSQKVAACRRHVASSSPCILRHSRAYSRIVSSSRNRNSPEATPTRVTRLCATSNSRASCTSIGVPSAAQAEAASAVNPSWNTPIRRKSARSSWVRRSWLQAIARGASAGAPGGPEHRGSTVAAGARGV